MGRDAKSKSVQDLLGPILNIHHSPLNGRNFESFSEDPHLSGIMAAAYVDGLQSEGVAATPKYFVCNDVETRRNLVDVLINKRALREICLKSFQMILRDADRWSIMTSLNSIQGEFACTMHCPCQS